MDDKTAKELGKQQLGVGSFLLKDPWVSTKDLLTHKVTIVGSNHGNGVAGDPLKYYLSSDGEDIGETIIQREDKKGYDQRYSIFTDKKGNLVCVAMRKKEFIHAHNCIYYYRTKPSFEGQPPYEETVGSIKGFGKPAKKLGMLASLTSSNPKIDEPAPYDTDKLYVWARLVTITNDDSVRRSLASVCKGVDPDYPSGFQWKALYKAIQMPQFMYLAVVLDMQDNIVCKSCQRSTMDSSAMYKIAPSADVMWILIACQCLIPDGTKIFDALETGVELATLGI